jgi:hypothetical protein
MTSIIASTFSLNLRYYFFDFLTGVKMPQGALELEVEEKLDELEDICPSSIFSTTGRVRLFSPIMLNC